MDADSLSDWTPLATLGHAREPSVMSFREVATISMRFLKSGRCKANGCRDEMYNGINNEPAKGFKRDDLETTGRSVQQSFA